MNPNGANDTDDLAVLFDRFVDQRIDEDELKRLEDRLRSDPAAREYCAERLHFEAEFKEVLDPRELEWLETRRVVLGRRGASAAWEIQRSQSLRYGGHTAPPAPLGVLRRKRWRLAGLAFAAVAAAAVGWSLLRPSAAPALALRNGDFEATDLTFSSSGTTFALIDWQDHFHTAAASLHEISRTSGGSIFAKSGRNVARLSRRGFLTQQLRFDNGQPLTAQPGLCVAVTGWAYAQGDEPHVLNGALRVVASAHPDMIQYEAATADATLEPGEWRTFRLEFRLAGNMQRIPSHSKSSHGAELPRLDLTGRNLTLSIDSYGSRKSTILLDDLRIESFQTADR